MSKPFRLIQLSDCHLFADRDKPGYEGVKPFNSLQNVLRRVAEFKPDAVLVTGDVSGDYSAESYLNFKHLWQTESLEVPLYALAGNHDQLEHWPLAFTTSPSSYTAKLADDWTLHLLGCQFEGTRGYLGEADVDAILAEMKREPDRHHMVALHHPLTNANVWMDRHALFNPEVGLKLTQSPLNPELILHGHVHTQRQVCVGNSTQLACPSTCWQWGNTKEFSIAELPPGFRIIDLQNNGRWQTQIQYLS